MDYSPQQLQAALRGLSGGSKTLGNLFNTDTSSATTGLGAGANALGAYNGLTSGNFGGQAGGAADLARLGTTNWGQNGSALSYLGADKGTIGGINTGATGALDALGVYQGLERGGVQGYGQALGSGIQGAGLLMNNPLMSTVGGYITAPLAVYNAIKNYKSGSTGSDALQGAEAGAAVGSVVPVVGTAIGAVVGGAAGALASAFGGGTDSQEAQHAQQYTGAYDQYANNPDIQKQLAAYQTPANNIQYLQGLMDAHVGSAGHESDLQGAFGKNNVAGLTTGMTQQINQALANGTINSDASPDEIYSKVVAPWIASKSGGATTGNDVKGNAAASPEQAALTNLIGQWEGGQFNDKSQVGVGGQTIGVQSFGALGGLGNPSNTTLTPDQIDKIKTGSVLDPATNYTTVMQGPNSTGAGALATISAANRAQSPQSAAAYDKMASSQPAPATPVNYNPGPSMSMQAPGYGNAEGGSMNKRKSALDTLKTKKRKRFDDGGIADWGDGSDDSGGGGDGGGGGAGGEDFSVPSWLPPPTGGGSDVSSWGQGTGDPANQIDAYGNAPGSANYLGVPTGSELGSKEPTSSTSWAQALANLKNNVTGANGPQGLINLLKGIAPIAGAIANKGKGANQKAPTAAPGMTYGATNPKAPTFNRTPVTNPSNKADGSPMSLQDSYTYGSRPEAAFFNNNQVNLAGATGVAQGQAHGGQAGHGSPLSMIGPDQGEFDSAQENYVQGAGDGTSDDIPAKLSDGEYVMDANTVAMLGNGSNKAGAERLDALRENLRKHAAAPMKKGKQFMHAKEPAAYMRGGKK